MIYTVIALTLPGRDERYWRRGYLFMFLADRLAGRCDNQKKTD